MQEQDLLASQDGPVLTLTLNRPALRNSMSPAIIGGLTERLAKVPEGVRVLVLTGAGDKAFWVGVFPMQVLAVLQHLVPRRKLIELCLTGELISAQEALALGLLNEVVPAAGLDAAVARTIEKLLAAAPSALRRGKYAMTAIETMDFEQAIAFLEGQIGAVALTEDAQEGMAAFREKRKPNWPGR
jgi:enoyl-CoA hydratase/carnithine racemase